MQELKKKNVKILSEKVLLLLNRGGKKKKKKPLFFLIFLSLRFVPTDARVLPLCPLFSRRPRVYVQTHPARTALGTQVSAGCLCQPRDGGHLLPHRHDGDD